MDEQEVDEKKIGVMSREEGCRGYHEDVVGLGDLAADPEQLEEVVELAVDVAADGDRRRDRLHVGFLEQKLLHLHGVTHHPITISVRRSKYEIMATLALLLQIHAGATQLKRDFPPPPSLPRIHLHPQTT